MKMYEGGKLSDKQVKWYFRGQMVLGAVLESLAFRQVPYVGLFLGGLTTAGATYLSLNPDMQDSVIRKAHKITVSFRSGVAMISNPEMASKALARKVAGKVAGKVNKVKKSCADLLELNPVNPVYVRHAYEDTQ